MPRGRCWPGRSSAFTFGAALKVQPDALYNEAAHLPRTALILVVATFGVPLLAGGLLLLLRPDPSLAQGIMFWAIVPTSPATVAFAAILGLPTSLALIITLVATAAAPAYLTLLAMAQDGLQLAADPLALCLKLLALTGSAFLAAALTRRFASATLARNPDVLTGIAVLALCLAGLGSMTGMQAAAMAEPERMAAITALAYGVTILVQAFGTALFWRCGREVALTAGLACSAHPHPGMGDVRRRDDALGERLPRRSDGGKIHSAAADAHSDRTSRAPARLNEKPSARDHQRTRHGSDQFAGDGPGSFLSLFLCGQLARGCLVVASCGKGVTSVAVASARNGCL